MNRILTKNLELKTKNRSLRNWSLLKTKNLKLKTILLLFLFLLMAMPFPLSKEGERGLLSFGVAFADTNVSGFIASNTTWTLANSPYIVTGNLIVDAAATLTIEPGVTVKFNSGKSLQVDGTLIARGTSGSLITFTSNQPSPASGDWGYILFSDSSTDATYDGNGNYTGGSILEYVTVEYAGGASVSDNGAVRVGQANPFINHCTIRNNNASGINRPYYIAGTFKITNNEIYSNTSSNSGGGIQVFTSGTVIIASNIISKNTSTSSAGGNFGGGGINAATSDISGSVTITNNIIKDNETEV